MPYTLTFQEYVIQELKEEEDNKNSIYEYDDYSMSSSNDIEYTIQE